MKVSGIVAMLKNRAQRESLYSTADYWDSKAAFYDDSSASMWPNGVLNEHYHQEQIAWLDQHLPELSGKRLLDLGCGTGRLSRHMASRGAIVTGVDFSAKAIDAARRMTQTENPSYRVQSVFDLDEVDRYDCVLCWGVVTIAARTREQAHDCMQRIFRAMRPGARILLMEPVHEGALHRVLAMNLGDFQNLMGSIGFDIRSVTHMHFWPVRLALAYFRFPGWITTPTYKLGQWVMGLTGNRAMGDYHAIYAVRPN